MTDLTDIQIIKRLAEIGNISYHIEESNLRGTRIMADLHNHTGLSEFNPLAKTTEGKALCFDFFNKHRVSVDYVVEQTWIDNDYSDCFCQNFDSLDEIQKAGCLTIIAKEDNKA